MATPSTPPSLPVTSTAPAAATTAACGLQEGLRLSRVEFERRSAERPDLKKVELVEGIVRMPSAVRYAAHGKPHATMVWWLGAYAVATPGVHFVDNTTLRLDDDNELQPDAALLCDPRAGGQARISPDDYIEGAPELVVEIAASSASYDLREKLAVYQRHGVREYLVWRVPDERIDWLELTQRVYQPRPADAAGVVRSTAFAGLWLDAGAMLRGDQPAVLRTLHQGLADPGHAAFVSRLADAQSSW